MVDGKVLPVYWFEGSIDGEAYLPAGHTGSSKMGLPPHVTGDVMEFLRSKFGAQDDQGPEDVC